MSTHKPGPGAAATGSRTLCDMRDHAPAASIRVERREDQRPVKPKQTRRLIHEDIIADAPFFSDLLEQALATIPSDEYSVWIETGMALHSWNQEAGLARWDTWSQKSSKYEEGSCQEMWATFTGEPKVTWGSIFRRAQENGWNRDNAVVTALAGLNGFDLHRWTTRCARWLDVREKAIKEEIAEYLPAGGTRGFGSLKPVEPWSEPVNGAELLDAILAVLRRFVILPGEAHVATALWVVHSFCFDLRIYTPRLHIWSPVKRCGKSTFLHVLNQLCRKPILASSMSGAAMFRIIDVARPTLLLDEYDSMPDGTRAEELRNVLNSGFQKDGVTYRATGQNFDPVCFSTFSPVIVAAIGPDSIPDTVADRAISIKMCRKLRSEHVERSRKFDGLEFRRKCARWVQDDAAAIKEANPAIPEELNDRQADVWEILFVLADLAGGEWPERARAAAVAMAARGEPETLPQVLLADIRAIFAGHEADRMKSEDLLKALNGMEERAWSTICKGREMAFHKLSSILKAFGIAPGSIRLPTGGTAKGYTRNQFEDAWERYLSPAQTPAAVLQLPLAPLDEEDVV